MRDQSIDVGRGLLTLLMVYCHVLQFFGDAGLFPAVSVTIDLINLTVFQTFVFYFGATAVLAYLRKPYRDALPGMLATTFRSYGAFVISGVAFRVLRENKPFGPGTIRRVMQLTDIPGWSEFLISFTGYALLLILLFPLFRRLADKPLWALAAGAVCFAATLVIPYDQVQPVHLALVIGGRQFAIFPVLHYMPFLLAGMVYARGGRKRYASLGIIAALCAAAGIIFRIRHGLPERFPPHWGWLALGAGQTALIVLLGKGLSLLAGSGVRRIADALCRVLSHFGSRSLYYLVASNIAIFTFAGKGVLPAVSRKSVLPWTTPIQSPAGAAAWTAALLSVLWVIALLAGRGAGRRKHTDKPAHD